MELKLVSWRGLRLLRTVHEDVFVRRDEIMAAMNRF